MLYQTTNPHGGEVYSRPVEIDFSANINPFGTPRAVLEAVIGSISQISQYPDPYCRELVEAIAAFEGVPKEYILCGNGASELIFSLCTAMKPRKAMLLAPCFSEYETALNAVGCGVERYYLNIADDFSLTDAFLPVLQSWDGDLLMLCNPNNPTGRVIPRPLMEKISRICQEKQIFLFIDECFLDLTEGGEELSMKDQLAENTNILLLKAFTKNFGMAGLRLGYCLSGNAALLKKMGEAVQAWNVSLPAQKAGVAALKDPSFLARANEVIREQRAIMTQAMQEMGLTVIPSRTNYILFYSKAGLRAPLLDRGIQIRACANYFGLGAGWYRVAVKLPEQNEKLLNAMKEILNG